MTLIGIFPQIILSPSAERLKVGRRLKKELVVLGTHFPFFVARKIRSETSSIGVLLTAYGPEKMFLRL